MKYLFLTLFSILFFPILCFSETAPPFSTVCEEALKHANLELHQVRGWEKNVRKAALLPRFQVGVERSLSNDVNINVEDSVSVSSSGVTIGPTQQQQTQTEDEDLNFEIKAVWYLDQLLFSRDRLEISQESRYLNEERQRVLNEVRKYYFQRERALKEIQIFKNAKSDSMLLSIKMLAVEESTAALDGFTGGWFSRAVEK